MNELDEILSGFYRQFLLEMFDKETDEVEATCAVIAAQEIIDSKE